jgi:hypothetical protein
LRPKKLKLLSASEIRTCRLIFVFTTFCLGRMGLNYGDILSDHADSRVAQEYRQVTSQLRSLLQLYKLCTGTSTHVQKLISTSDVTVEQPAPALKTVN